jgi:hypothetical protein
MSQAVQQRQTLATPAVQLPDKRPICPQEEALDQRDKASCGGHVGLALLLNRSRDAWRKDTRVYTAPDAMSA